MALRQEAERAIRRWDHEFGRTQKTLAAIVGVSDTTISRCLNEPEWPVADDTLHKIVNAVADEASKRAIPFEMMVVAYCHDQTFETSKATNDATISAVRNAIARGSCECNLPKGCRAALIRLGAEDSHVFLIVLSHATNDDEKRALAHELEHIRNLVLSGIKVDVQPPRSSY